MLKQYNNSNLLNLEDVIVDDVVQTDDGTHIIAHLLEQEVRVCPRCGSTFCHVHDHRWQIIKDLPAYGKKTYLHLDKRRYACQECGKRFYEPNKIQPKYYHCTSRLIASVLDSFKETVSATHIAKEHNISTSTDLRYFDYIGFVCKSMPNVLSIDEFKGNADGQKYQSIITNPNKGTIIDILPDRYENHLIEYFLKFSNRNAVEYFVMDMNVHFLRVAETCFPKATVIVDRFHVIRQVTWAVENVRINAQQELSSKYRKYFKRSRKLLYTNKNELNDDDKENLALMLEISPKLADAYRIYWHFIDVVYSCNSVIGKERLKNWLFDAEVSGIEELKPATTAIHNWDKYILNSMDCPYSNGFTEGCNNKTKVLKRVCYGIRRFDRLRNRILYLAA